MNPKFFLSILAAVLLAGSAQAQYTGNNQTNTITGVAVDWLVIDGPYYVGQHLAYDALVIQAGGVLSNTLGFIGSGSGGPAASNNSVLVTGSGSVWSNTSNLFVGDDSAGNSLNIINGGTVYNSIGYIGDQVPGSSNNTVLVSGSGSVWMNGFGTNTFSLYVGNIDVGNSLTITNGATVYNDDGEIGYQFGANSNTVVVTGSGSVWSNAGPLFVGSSGSGNSLTIADGGTVYNSQRDVASDNGYIGYSFDDNTVLVTGSGSVWNNVNDLYVGNAGASNLLTIASGGSVVNENGYIGNFSDNNTVVVIGSGSVWNNGSDLYVGNTGSGNSLTIAAGGGVGNIDGFIGNGSRADSNTVVVTGSSSVWNNASDLYIGNASAGNSLVISNGGGVGCGNGTIGATGGSSNNTVVVTGSGSVWNNSSSLNVGDAGAGNSLTISNGGYVFCDGGAIGASAGSSNNMVVVSGGGSLVVTNPDLDATLFVSQNGGADSLVLNGGAVTVNQLYLVNGSNSIVTFNAGTLNSGGTIVTTPQNFTVGDGTDTAVFHLGGGEHSFVYGSLEIQSNAVLTGCGDINGGVLIDEGGTVLVDCGGTLTFSRSVENDGVVEVLNGSTLVADDTFDNEGLIIVIDGSTEFRNGSNGAVLTEKEVQISSITRSGNNIIIQVPAGDATYQLQVTPSFKPTNWTDVGDFQEGPGMLTFTDFGGATNRPSRFYRLDISVP